MSTPDYYKSKIQAIDYIEANNLDFNEGNVIKYITRYKQKGGMKDLTKALYYLERIIQSHEDIVKGVVEYKDGTKEIVDPDLWSTWAISAMSPSAPIFGSKEWFNERR